jgi:hypothetical protein
MIANIDGSGNLYCGTPRQESAKASQKTTPRGTTRAASTGLSVEIEGDDDTGEGESEDPPNSRRTQLGAAGNISSDVALSSKSKPIRVTNSTLEAFRKTEPLFTEFLIESGRVVVISEVVRSNSGNEGSHVATVRF